MTMKPWMAAALLLGSAVATTPAAAFGVLTVREDPVSGYVGIIPTSSPEIRIGSDGEGSFDPFGAGFDTSDGIVLNSNWIPDPKYAKAFAAGYWTQLPGTFTWVLPACNSSGCENADIIEPKGKWIYAPGGGWAAGTLSVKMVDIDGKFSDFVRVANDGPGGSATITFQSGGTIPEPASWALMLVGFAAVGYATRRQTVRRAVVAS